MKKILTILLAGASTLAFAQKKSNLSKSIDDDGKTLSIHARGTINGKDIDFDKSFTVVDLSKDEQDSNAYTKQVKYNPESGELFLRYRFFKNNEEFIYEKTVDAIDKSEIQRKRIIEEFENEIELPGKGLDM